MLINGDCLEELKKLEANSVHSVVSDPPYGLSIIKSFQQTILTWLTEDDSFIPKGKGFMDKSWDSFVPPPAVWKEVYRVLKPGGHALVFSGSRTQDIMGISLRLAGFEVRDVIQWIYSSGFPKSHNLGIAVDKVLGNERTNLGRNPNSRENIKQEDSLYRLGTAGKTGFITKGSSDWEGWGTALKPAYEPVLLVRKPIESSTVAKNCIEHGAGGLNIDATRIEYDPDEKLSWGVQRQQQKGDNGWSGHVAKVGTEIERYKANGRFPSNVMLTGVDEEWSRYFYCKKASKKEKGEGNIHPTVKPIDLMKYLCRLITPKGGTILDPFMGSGTTGIAANLEGFEFIGIEREEQYFHIAKTRISEYSSTEDELIDGEYIQLDLFG